MKTLISKLTSGAAAIVAIVLACVFAALGLTAMVYLAIFGLAVLGLSFLAAPFVAMAQKKAAEQMDDMPSENLSASQ